jgi:protein TonB
VTTLTDEALLDFGGGDVPSAADVRVTYTTGVEENSPRGLRAASAFASFGLHLFLFAAAASWVSQRSGLVPEESAALSIELVLTAVVEQLPAEEISDVTQEAAKAIAAPADPPASELKAVDTEPEAVTSRDEPPQGVEAIEGNAAIEDAVGKEHGAREDEPKAEHPTAKESAKPPKKIERVEQRAPTPRKAATEDPSVGAKAKAPRASASTGSVLNYASRVRAKVSGHVPRSGSGKGSVIVSFGVTASGGLSYARIAKSSGNAATDRLVLAGVRSAAPFPSPPAGASPSQLRFSVSFHFR